MKKGFTFGKYLPFHNGHKSLIDYGLVQYDQFFVIVCRSQSEEVSVDIRASWIEETYQYQTIRPQVVRFEYNEDELANTSVSSKSVSEAWSRVFVQLLPKMDGLVTSEPYGDFVAKFMGIRHDLFDLNRTRNSISSTDIRKSRYHNWNFMPDAVKIFYQKKVVFLGTESTGKSSISEALSNEFNASLVKEAGREVIEDSNNITKELLLEISVKHANNILKARQKLTPLILIDTDIHITQSYAMFQYGEYLDVSKEDYKSNKAHLYIYLTSDMPYEQDGTRLSESARNRLDEYHRNTLKAFEIDFVEVSGSWKNRLSRCSKLIEELII